MWRCSTRKKLGTEAGAARSRTLVAEKTVRPHFMSCWRLTWLPVVLMTRSHSCQPSRAVLRVLSKRQRPSMAAGAAIAEDPPTHRSAKARQAMARKREYFIRGVRLLGFAEADFFFVAVEEGDAVGHPGGGGGVLQEVVEELVHALGEVLLVGAAAETVQLVVVVEEVDLLAVAAQGEEELDGLRPWHDVVVVVVHDQERCLDLVGLEDRRVFDVELGRLLQRGADAALVLLVLELARTAGAVAHGRGGAGHVADDRTGLGGAEAIRLRDDVARLVAAPRMALEADALLVDVALGDDGVGRGHDAAIRTLAGMAGRVDDVRHEHDVAVARVESRVDDDGRCGRHEAVHDLREALVDVDDHRVLLRRVEVGRLAEHALQLLAVRAAVGDQLGRTPEKRLQLRAADRDLFRRGEFRVGGEDVGELVEAGAEEQQRVGIERTTGVAVILLGPEQALGLGAEEADANETRVAGGFLFRAKSERLREIDAAPLVAGLAGFEGIEAQLEPVLTAVAAGQVAGGTTVREHLPEIVAIVDQQRL